MLGLASRQGPVLRGKRLIDLLMALPVACPSTWTRKDSMTGRKESEQVGAPGSGRKEEELKELTWGWWGGGQAAGGWGDVPRDEGQPSARAWSGHPPPGVPAGSLPLMPCSCWGAAAVLLWDSTSTHLHVTRCHQNPKRLLA